MLNVLIIDDDRDLAASIAEYLEVNGHQVDIEFSGMAGIEAASEKDYDQIILDIGLPDVNGVDSMLAIRDTRPDARIILITGHSAGYLYESVSSPGDFEVLTKPLELDLLLQRLADISDSQSG